MCTRDKICNINLTCCGILNQDPLFRSMVWTSNRNKCISQFSNLNILVNPQKTPPSHKLFSKIGHFCPSLIHQNLRVYGLKEEADQGNDDQEFLNRFGTFIKASGCWWVMTYGKISIEQDFFQGIYIYIYIYSPKVGY